MKKHSLIVTAMVLLPSLSSRASTEPAYQSEISGGFQTSAQSGNTNKSYAAAGGFSYYFEPVEYGEYPYVLATFFSRTPSIQLSYTTEHGKTDPLMHFNSDLYGIGYNSASNESPLTYGLSLIQYTYKQDSGTFSTKQDSNMVALSVGYYLTKFSQIELTVSKMYSEFRADFLNENSTITFFSLDYYHVIPLANDQYLSITGDVTRTEVDPDSSTSYSIQLGYFPEKSFGLGVGASSTHGDLPDDSHSASIIAQYYYTPKASVSLLYDKYFASDSSENSKTYGVNADFRF